MEMNELLEKAKRDYPIGTKFKSVFTEDQHTSTGNYVMDDNDVFIKNKEGWWCIYYSKRNQWAEIIKEDDTLLEKAKKDYPKGTKFKSVFTLIEHICDGYYEILNKDVYVKEYGSNMVRCIYRTKTNQWAEIIKEETMTQEEYERHGKPYNVTNIVKNTMTQEEFNSLRVGDFINNYEILHKYNEFLIVKCDDGHDLLDLAKINKLGLKVTPKTFMGLEVKKYDNVPCEVGGNSLAYLVEVRSDDVLIRIYRDNQIMDHVPTSIRIL